MSLAWEPHKGTIRDLYLVKDLSRQEVMKIMEERYGFKADAGQYERQFKKWAFRKTLPPETWQFVARCIKKRKKDGKETDFKIDGIRVPEKKLQKAISRYGEGPMWTPTPHKLSQEMNRRSATPEGLCFSPQATCSFPDLGLDALQTLPWFKFSTVTAPWLLSRPELSSALAVNSIRYPQTVYQALSLAFLPPLLHGHVSQPQHGFWSGSGPNDMMLTAFLASNQIRDADLLSQTLVPQNALAASSIFRQLQDPEFSKFLGRLDITKHPTLDALLEVVLKEALESQNVDFVETLLKTTKPWFDERLPGPWKDSNGADSRTPLHIAIISGSSSMVQLLLQHGADPHEGGQGMSDLLCIAMLNGKQEIVRLLLQAYKEDPTLAFRTALKWKPRCVNEMFWMEMLNFTSDSAIFKAEMLFAAVTSGWASSAQGLLRNGTNVNVQNTYGNTPLLVATRPGQKRLQAASLLITSGAKIESHIDRQGRRTPTALQLAAYWNNTELAALLMDLGADINAEGCDEEWQSGFELQQIGEERLWKQNALSLAVKFAEPCLVQMLLQKGAQIGDTVLASAVRNSCLDNIQLLLEYGARYSNHILLVAASTWTLDVIRHCLDLRLDVNYVQDGMNAFSAAASRLEDDLVDDVAGFKEICDLLLDFGADINLPNVSPTALELSIKTGRADVVDFLLSRGAHCGCASSVQTAIVSGDCVLLKKILAAASTHQGFHLCYTTSCLGHPAFFEAVSHSSRLNGGCKMVEIFVETGINLVNPCASMALKLLCSQEDLNMSLIKRLLEAGIQIDLPDLGEDPPCWKQSFSEERLHPLQLLAERGDDEAVRLLLEFGANTNLFGQNVLHIGRSRYTTLRSILCSSVTCGQLSTIRLLLDAGADVNSPARGDFGHTALQTAAQLGQMNTLEELVRVGADVNAGPAEFGGVTALQAAAIGGFTGIAVRLVELGADVNAAAAEKEGRTALEGASEHGRIDMVQFLLTAGADVQSPDFGAIQHENAVNFARKWGYNAVARLLKRHWESLG